MVDVFQQIREKNVIDYGKKFEDWAPRILVDQYSDRTHFLFELLQNAEDAEATTVSIELGKDQLVLKHDGRMFNEDDVRGICGVSSSTKRNANNRIGKFGIGFKSVYAYTQTPHIQSGDYSFSIKNLIMPYAEKTSITTNLTVFTLPFDLEDVSSIAFREISSALKRFIVPDSMLTLRNLRKISYSIVGQSESVVLSKSTRTIAHGVQEITLKMQVSGHSMGSEKKLIAFVSDDLKPIMIAYQLEEQSQGKKAVIPAKQPHLYAYFPTAIETHQAFYIHAPFDTTPARDNVRRNEYNENLISDLALKLRESIIWLRQKKLISIKFFNQVFPLYQYNDQHILYPLFQSGLDLIRSDADVLPTTTQGQYVSLSDAFIPESQNIIQCFDDAMLAALMTKNEARWLDKAIASESSRTFRNYLTDNFTVKTLGWKALVTKLTPKILERQSDVWLSSLLRSIQPYCYSERGDDRIAVENIPLVRLQTGQHCLAKSDGKALVYLNNPKSCPRKIKSSLLSDFFVKSFYSKILGIQTYDIFQEIQNEILPTYVENPQDVTFALNLQHIHIFEKAYKENSVRLGTLVKSAPCLRSNGKWMSPESVYIPRKYFRNPSDDYALLENLDLDWLDGDYLGRVSADTLIWMGCKYEARAVDASVDEYENLLSIFDNSLYLEYCNKIKAKNYQSSRDGFNVLRSIEGLHPVIDSINLEGSVALANFIGNNINTFKLRGSIFAANDAALRGKSLQQIDGIPSMLCILLLSAHWLYTSDGKTSLVSEVRRSELSSQYSEAARELFALLPFLPEDKAVDEIVEKYDPRYHDFLSDLLNNQDALCAAYNVYEKRKKVERKTSGHVSVKEMFGAMSNQQSYPKTAGNDEDDDLLDVAGMVSNPKRRSDKLADVFRASIQSEPKALSPRVTFSFSTCNVREREFLLSQYQGHCQICKKQIIKRDGTPYFVARNMLDTSGMAHTYDASFQEGWNSLCLCPNCAAEYLHCTRDLRTVPEQVKGQAVESNSSDELEIVITLQGQPVVIHYTPKHFLSLQSALKVFLEDQEGDE